LPVLTTGRSLTTCPTLPLTRISARMRSESVLDGSGGTLGGSSGARIGRQDRGVNVPKRSKMVNLGITDRRCCWCGERIAPDKRKHSIYCTPKCRREAFSARPCMYCGVPADSRDHFVPRSYTNKMRAMGSSVHVSETVPCCRECNSTAGATIFSNVREKRFYIQDKYRNKYAKILNTPDWTQKELDELGPTLKSHVINGLRAKEITKQRIAWRGPWVFTKDDGGKVDLNLEGGT
jgi:hypothetical protein